LRTLFWAPESLIVKTLRYGDIVAATNLTRAGNLTQATKLLQTAVTGAIAPVDTGAPAAIALREAGGRFIARVYRSEAGARTYKLYVSDGYNGQACPLIVMMHGCTQSADDFAAGTRMNELAEEKTFLVAYPEQSVSANAQKCWNWFRRADQQRDCGEPSLVAGITRQIMGEYIIDRKRVYVAGMSAGAAGAAVLGATYPDLYAAVGVHSGLACGLARDVRSAFSVMRSGEGSRRADTASPRYGANAGPIATIVFHGDRDATVNKCNGDRFAEEFSTTRYVKRVKEGQIPGGRAYTQTVYADESGQSVLEQWTIHGAGSLAEVHDRGQAMRWAQGPRRSPANPCTRGVRRWKRTRSGIGLRDSRFGRSRAFFGRLVSC
jgi:poly(hydroxyalkanoate) depolymerase family esterase